MPGARRGGGFSVLSAGADGRILVWQLDSEGQLTLSDGFALVTQQVPRNIKLSKVSERGRASLKVAPSTVKEGVTQFHNLYINLESVTV